MIEEIEKQLALTHDLVQPSKDTLHRRAASSFLCCCPVWPGCHSHIIHRLLW